MKRAAALTALWVLAACRTAPEPVPDAMVPSAPGPSGGIHHEVEKGQTLWRIARTYEVSVQELAEHNDLTDPSRLRVGQRLWIPGAAKVRKVAPAPGTATPQPASTRPEPPADRVEVARSRFIWPVKGVLYSKFGMRGGTQHDGIDISAPKGTPVVAADAGEVLYSGTQRGYGNIVLVRHADGLITIYAHNSENLVKAGEKVTRGQVIARVGKTGRATGHHLHFEVRKNRVPRNPLFFLP